MKIIDTDVCFKKARKVTTKDYKSFHRAYLLIQVQEIDKAVSINPVRHQAG